MSRNLQQGPKSLTTSAIDPSRFPSSEIGLAAGHITSAVEYARTFSYEGGEHDFRREVQKWEYDNLPALLRGMEVLYGEGEIKKHGVQKATEALFGALVGGVVVRSVTDEGITSLDSCRANLDTWRIMERGFTYDGVKREHDEMLDIFGPDVAKGFAEISKQAASSMCALVLGVTLEPMRASETGYVL